MFESQNFHRKAAEDAKGRKGNKDKHPCLRFSFANFAPLRLCGEVFAVVFLVLTAPLAHAGAIDKLRQFVDTTKTLRADFTQTVVAKNGKKPQQSTGVVMLSRPGKFRWQIDKPYNQLLVGDGQKVWIYDPELRQVTVKKVDQALGSTPAALLVGDALVEKNFNMREAGERAGLEWLAATPKSADSGFEKVELGFAGDELRAMELHDNFGQTTSLVFSRLERNPQIAASQFRFTPPAGVDVLGE